MKATEAEVIKFDIDEKTYAKVLEAITETGETFDEFVEHAVWFRLGQLSMMPD